MQKNKSVFSVVIMPGARYRLVGSHECPLGRDTCHVRGPDAAFCTRCTSDGDNVGCVCRTWGGKLGPDDIKSFGNEVRFLAGATVLDKIIRELNARVNGASR